MGINAYCIFTLSRRRATKPSLSSVSSLARLLLEAAYGDDQIGAFENFHQLLKDALVVLRPGPKEFLEDELRFVDRLKSQLLIGHLYLPICTLSRTTEGARIKPLLGNAPVFLSHWINFYFNGGGHRRTIGANRLLDGLGAESFPNTPC